MPRAEQGCFPQVTGGPPTSTRLEAPAGKGPSLSCSLLHFLCPDQNPGTQQALRKYLWNGCALSGQQEDKKGRVHGEGMGRWDPRIHWSSMLLSVKRVLEKRAKPSRYSQARRGMYCDRRRNRRKEWKKISTRTFTPPSFCTCCSLHLARHSFFPTSLQESAQTSASFDSTPSFPGAGVGEKNKVKGLLCSPPLETAPLQAVFIVPTR